MEPPVFDIDVLISALRIATTYDYPTLRRFAIQKLEQRGLPLLEHLPIARELNIPKWENMVLGKLAARAEPVTLAEAQVLGMDVFVSLAARRERERVRPGETSSALVPLKRKESEETLGSTSTREGDHPKLRRKLHIRVLLWFVLIFYNEHRPSNEKAKLSEFSHSSNLDDSSKWAKFMSPFDVSSP